MKSKSLHALGLLTALLCMAASTFAPPRFFQPPYPQDWPAPHYDFASHPLNAEAVALGRHLFYDPVLSRDSSTSCSSCHLSFTAFTHVDHALSHGIGDSIGTRNSPVLINLAWNRFFMWDGAVNHIEVQGLAPITHEDEMGEDIGHVVDKLNASAKYPPLFEAAFGSAEVTGERLLKALAQFQLTFISANSKYDRVKRGEEGAEFTEQEEKGYVLFQSHCNSCHREPLFTTGEFANNGLPVDSTLTDLGRMGISLDPADSLKFKIPTLRNIEFSYPYMHDGRFNHLSEVMRHYSDGIVHGPTLAPELEKGPSLSENDRVDLVAFLLTLSDREFLFNPDFGFPRE